MKGNMARLEQFVTSSVVGHDAMETLPYKFLLEYFAAKRMHAIDILPFHELLSETSNAQTPPRYTSMPGFTLV